MKKTIFPEYARFFAYLIFGFGLLMPIFIWTGFQKTISISHYLITAQSIRSIKGFAVIALAILQMTVAYGIIRDRPWAILLGLLDSLIGITCYIVFTVKPFIYYDPTESRTLGTGIIFLLIYFSLMHKLYIKHLRNTDTLRGYLQPFI